MSNYSKTTDFAAKDALTTGNANKIVKGTEIDDEFSAIQTAVNTKADVNSPTFTGTPAAPTASAATNTTQISTTAYVTAAVEAVRQTLFPVGTIYTQAAVATNPATLLGFGTWAAFGAGRVMVGLDGGNALFDTVEETGGSADSIVPSHTHTAASAVTDGGHVHGSVYQPGGGTGVDDFNGDETYSMNGSTGSAVTGITVATTVSTEGVSVTDTNYQPYITVYMWKRTA
jgi:hypothetical protein